MVFLLVNASCRFSFDCLVLRDHYFYALGLLTELYASQYTYFLLFCTVITLLYTPFFTSLSLLHFLTWVCTSPLAVNDLKYCLLAQVNIPFRSAVMADPSVLLISPLNINILFPLLPLSLSTFLQYTGCFCSFSGFYAQYIFSKTV